MKKGKGADLVDKKLGSKLKYCPTCDQVWEFHAYEKKDVKHPEFPSYGLPREVCSECNAIDN